MGSSQLPGGFLSPPQHRPPSWGCLECLTQFCQVACLPKCNLGIFCGIPLQRGLPTHYMMFYNVLKGRLIPEDLYMAQNLSSFRSAACVQASALPVLTLAPPSLARTFLHNALFGGPKTQACYKDHFLYKTSSSFPASHSCR